MTSRTYIFEELPVRQAVCKQVIPAIASQMIALLYSLADTYFVGMLNIPAQTAAITIVYSCFIMLTALSNLFGIGGASVIARRLGKKDTQAAQEISALCFWCSTAVGICFSLLFLLFARPVLSLCGANKSTFPFAYAYAKWVIVYGGIFSILNTLLANLIRAEGNAAQASFGLSLGGILNTVLDPLFILPQFLGFGVVGAGIATALSNFISVLYFLFTLCRQKQNTLLSLHPRHLIKAPLYLKEVLQIGFPSALQYGLTVVAVAAQTRFVSQYPTEAIAALGIIKKLDQLPLYFSIGTASGLLPLLAYTHSAGNETRRKQAFHFGISISFGFSMLCLIIYELFAPQLASLFISDTTTIAYSASFLRRMVTAMPFMALCYPMIIQFQAMGKVKEALITSILRKGILDIPLLFVMDAFLPLYGCMWVQPIVDFISLLVATAFYRRLKS